MSASLSALLQGGEVLHLPARVTHARRGGIRHAFAYGVDYLLLDPDRARPRTFFSRNRFNLFALHDRDHGGPRGAGDGAAWARKVFAGAGLTEVTVALMIQPRFLGYWFCPVSFWLALRGDRLLAVIAEVNNTFGQRHSYLCHHAGFAPIAPGDELTATKAFHVSPFQDMRGTYHFRFAISTAGAAISIHQIDGKEGLIATMHGALAPATPMRLLGAALKRPGGAMRVIVLIYWNALRLKLKGAGYRPLPSPPDQEVSR
ncbi:DUF1365 domain-containing protein [Alloyangia pacifica]|uniref:Cyclopropane-fatty-acyl-phospholipid synthase n=1 Tax=Alloyangia pacifica TaxID=311180 RepID=A0A1I6S1C5_9RHOB|nr:DUF1365 domain-containing protein [Alloyangia pacifica]SDG68769.1 hypothetical protein SAMN04488245_10462 [Alloyangia pacifica]SFS70763.1 hypothetical protein SAMN04488050_10462 [Alloyangia pacifica]